MSEGKKEINRFWAFVVTITGICLFLGGLASTVGYLGLPVLVVGPNVLGAQLGQIAGIFLGLAGGGLALYHGFQSIRKRPSRPLRLPHAFFFGLTFAIVLALGNVLIEFEVAEEYLFPFTFLLGSALPTFAVVAWASRRLAWPLTWRQGGLMLVAGSTLSIIVAIILEILLPFLVFVFVVPLEDLAFSLSDTLSDVGPGFLERFFFSPMILVVLVVTAFQAPIPEEFAKALGPLFMGRRIRNERQAFTAGLVSGAGFAILENMLYEGLYAQWSGWTWGGVTLLRGIGSVLHPLCTGVIALAWFRNRKRGRGWFGPLAKAYLLSVGLHTLWNGGFEPLLYLTGLEYFGGQQASLNFYGEGVAVLLVAYLVFLSVGLWWLLRYFVKELALEAQPQVTPVEITRRGLAGWAFACVLVIVPIGVMLGPAWRQIQKLLTAGAP